MIRSLRRRLGRTGALAVLLVVLSVCGAVAPVAATGPQYTSAGSDAGATAVPAATLAAGAGPRAQVSTAAATIGSCTSIEQSGVYELTGDVETDIGFGTTCIAVNASDVTIDGNGHSITSNGTGTGVGGQAAFGRSNVTVRDLTVRNVTDGVVARQGDDVTVERVTVEGAFRAIDVDGSRDTVVADVDVTLTSGANPAGVDAGATTRARLSDVHVRKETATNDGYGVILSGSVDGRVDGVTVENVAGAHAAGLWVSSARNLTVASFDVAGFDWGVEATSVRNVRLRDGSIRGAVVATTFADPANDDAQTPGTTETGSVSNLTIRNLSRAPAGRYDGFPTRSPAYVRLDGTNDVQVQGLSTPDATVATLAGRNVTLGSVGSTPTPPRNVTVGVVNVTEVGPSPQATVGFGYDGSRLREDTIGLYDAGFNGWQQSQGYSRQFDPANDTATVTTTGGRVYGAFAEPNTIGACTRINESGAYDLTGNLSRSSGATCLGVNASDVTIDGNGHAVTGTRGGVDVGVGVVRPGLSNVTVRNLTVANVTTGVNVTDATDATVSSLTVRRADQGLDAGDATGVVVDDARLRVTDEGHLGTPRGADFRSTTGLRVTDLVVDPPDGSIGEGLDVGSLRDGHFASVTLRGAGGQAMQADYADNVTFDGLTISGYVTGIYAPHVRQFDLRNVTIRDVASGIRFLEGITPQTSTVESGTLENVTFSQIEGDRGVFVRTEGTNDLRFRDLRTPNATLSSFDAVNLTLRPATVGGPPSGDTTVGRVNLTEEGTRPAANVTFAYQDRRIRESSLGVYRLAFDGWRSVSASARTIDRDNDTAAVRATSGGVYGVGANGTTISGCTRIDEGGVYPLAGNVSFNGTGTCIAVNASNVTIDGNGRALVGPNTTGSAVRTPRAGLSNLTVRNLTVDGWFNGVFVQSATDVTVRNLTGRRVGTVVETTGVSTLLVRDVDAAARTAGVEATGSTDATVRDISVRSLPGGTGIGSGITLDHAGGATVRNVTVRVPEDEDGFLPGVSAVDTSFLAMRDVTVSGANTGVAFERSTDLDVTGLDIDRAVIALRFRTFVGGTSAFESGQIDDVTITDPGPRSEGTVLYALFDGSNSLTVTNLTTPNATTSILGRNVTLDPVRKAPAPPANLTGGVVNVTPWGSGASARLFVHYTGAVRASTVDFYRADGPGAGTSWSRLPDADVTYARPQRAVGTNVTSQWGPYAGFAAPKTVDACTTLNESGTYTVTGDVPGTVEGSDTCLGVNASDVTIAGAGHAVTGNGSGTGVGVVQSGLSNVTVRNLSVDGYDTGVGLGETTNATVAAVTASGRTAGIDARNTGRLSVRDATVEATGPNGDGLILFTASRPTVDGLTVRGDGRRGIDATSALGGRVVNLSVTGGYDVGLGVFSTTDAVVHNASLAGADVAVAGSRATNLTATGLTVTNATTALRFRRADVADTLITETATVTATVASLRAGADGTPAAYLRADADNDVRATIDTPDAPLEVRVSNGSVGPTTTAPAPPNGTVPIGRVNVTAAGTDASARVVIGYDEAGLREQTVDVYRVAGDGWDRLADGAVSLDAAADTVTANVTAAGTYGAFASTRTITGCGEVNESGTYRLTGDVTTTGTGSCIRVTAPNVTVDGNGHALVGDGQGTAVSGTLDADGVTVRDLAVVDWDDGVVVESASDVRVVNVTVDAFAGVDVSSTTNATVSGVTATGVGLVAVDVGSTTNATVRDLLVTNDYTDALEGGSSVGLTARNVTYAFPDSASLAFKQAGVSLPGATGFDVAGLTVTGALRGIVFASDGVPQTATVERGTVRNVTVALGEDPDAAPVSRLDGSNDVRIYDLRTPEGTYDRLTGTNVTVRSPGETPAPPASVAVARFNVTAAGTAPTGEARVRFDPAALNASTVDVYRVSGGSWVDAPVASGGSTSAGVRSVLVSGAGDYGVFAAPNAVESCRTFDEAGTYTLTSDLSAAGGACLTINASGVTIDGAGHAIVGDGTGTAVATSRDGLSDLIVRDLTVRAVSTGVSTSLADDVRVEDVTVAADTGVDAPGTDGLQIRNVTVRNGTGVGLSLAGTSDLAVRQATVEGAYTTGLLTTNSVDVTLRSLTVTGASTAVQAPRVLQLDAANLSLSGVETGLLATEATPTGTTATESGTVRDVTVSTSGPDPTLLRVDGSNDLAVRNLSTADATVANLTGVNVSLVLPGTTPTAPQNGTLARFGLEATGDAPRLSAGIRYDPTRVTDGSIGLYRVSGGNWVTAAGATGQPTPAVRSLTVTSAGTYGLFADRLSIDRCTTVAAPGTYTVTGNLTADGSGGTCLSVNASNVTIDGAGHAVVGDGTGTGVATARAGLSEVTVRNLTVETVETGVDLRGARTSTVTDVTVADAAVGARLNDSTGVLVEETSVGAVTDRGVVLGNATSAELATVSVGGADSGATAGVVLDGAGGLVARNVSVGTVTTGLAVLGPADGRVTGLATDDVQRPVRSSVDALNLAVLEIGTPDGTLAFVPNRSGLATVGSLAEPTPAAAAETVARLSLTPGPSGGPGISTIGGYFDPTELNVSAVQLYRYDPSAGDWARSSAGVSINQQSQTRVIAIANVDAPGRYGFFETAGTIADCRSLDRSGTYVLSSDVSGTGTGTGSGEGPCVSVAASNVTIDGNGATVDAAGGTAVGVTTTGLSNVTVRDLTVRNGTTGVDVTGTTNATVRDVTVADAETGVNLTGTTDGTVRTVSVGSGSDVGLALGNATGLDARALTLNATTGIRVRAATGRVANATAIGPRPFVATGDASGLAVTGFATPTGEVAFAADRTGLGRVAGSNVTVANGTVTATVARLNVTGTQGGTLSTTVPYDGSLNDSTVGLYRLTDTASVYDPVASVGNAPVTVNGSADELAATLTPGKTYAVLAVNPTGTDGSARLGERLFPDGLPGGAPSSGIPTDANGDGLLEDLDGNGQFQFVDVIEFVFAIETLQSADLSDPQAEALDFNGDGEVTFVDVIDLVFRV